MFCGHQSQLPVGSPIQNSHSNHSSSLAGDNGDTRGAQNLPPKKPRDEEHDYKQEFQIEQHQEYKSEEMLGRNKISYYNPSESSQSLADPIYNHDTAIMIPERPEHLSHSTNSPDYLITRNEEEVLGDKVKVDGNYSSAMTESSSEGNGNQLHKGIDEEIHKFAEQVNEQASVVKFSYH